MVAHAGLEAWQSMEELRAGAWDGTTRLGNKKGGDSEEVCSTYDTKLGEEPRTALGSAYVPAWTIGWVAHCAALGFGVG